MSGKFSSSKSGGGGGAGGGAGSKSASSMMGQAQHTIQLGVGAGSSFLTAKGGTAIFTYDKDGLGGGTLKVAGYKNYMDESKDFEMHYSPEKAKKLIKFDKNVWKLVGEKLENIKVMFHEPGSPIWAPKRGGEDAVSRVYALMTATLAVCKVVGQVLGKLPASPQKAGVKAQEAKQEMMALFNIFLPAKFSCWAYSTLKNVVDDILDEEGHHGYKMPEGF
jgi:hypothetical protein